MGKVKVVFFGVLTKITGEKKGDLEAVTLGEAIERLIAKYGESLRNRVLDKRGYLRRFINVYVNGRDVRFLKNLETELNDGDEISIIPAVGGG